ncbi:hypothetical protein ACIBTV_29585 [Micromonospora sp. NPDC049366]|uniref:hypothetical protein n=1 Tax=Micromonospora sp. NPDC049366 TaxID=3364271 RepID=UPI00379AA6BA
MREPNARWYGNTLVIGEDDRLPGRLVEALPAETDRCTVLLAGDAPQDPDLVARAVGEQIPEPASIRLACSGAGPAVIAQRLAERLDIEVVAPVGPTMLVAPGALFVVTRPHVAAWRVHRPGARPGAVAPPRHPAPEWQAPLPRQSGWLPDRVLAHDLPAGYWLRRPQRRPVAPDDPAYAIEVDDSRMVVLVGQPDRRPPSPWRVYRWLTRLPRVTLDRLVLMPYGPWGSLLDVVAARLSADLRLTVTRTAGLPVRRHGTTYHVPVDAAGRTGPLRPAQTVSYPAGDPVPHVDSWISPVSGRLETGPAVEQAADGWVLEVVRGGYWLRPADQPARDDVRHRPAGAADTFVVDADAAEASDLARTLVSGLPAGMAVDVRFEPPVAAPPPAAAVPTPPPPTVPSVVEAPTAPSATTAEPASTAVPAAPTPRSVPQVSPITATAVAASPATVPRPAVAGNTPTASASPAAATPTAAPVRAPRPEPAPPAETRHTSQASSTRDTIRTTPKSTATHQRTAGGAAATPRGDLAPAAAPPAQPPLRRGDSTGPAPAARRSTPQEQAGVRDHLGARYDVHARDVSRLLIRRPGIRPAADETADAVMADLVAVAATLHAASTAEAAPLRACLVSGLNRLPTVIGPVLARTPADPDPYRPGEFLTSPDLLRAEHGRRGEAQDVLVVHSLTGRRPGALSERDEVLFAPGTVFRVLDTAAHNGVHHVLLREVAEPGADTLDDEQVLSILRAAASRRP